VIQEESPINEMVSMANTCDYLVVEPMIHRLKFSSFFLKNSYKVNNVSNVFNVSSRLAIARWSQKKNQKIPKNFVGFRKV